MKMKSGLILLIMAMLMVACSSPAPAAEPVMEKEAVVDEEVMVESEPAVMEEEAAMEDDAHSDDAMMAEVSFIQDVWPIIEEYALNAHGGKGGVFLESYEDILNYVTPGDPENSMLYKALIGDGLKLMPPDGPLPDEMIQTFYDWIAQGALNN